MSDRLQELLRQRALVQEQLAWFDREIAATTAGQRTAPHATGLPPPRPGPVPVAPGYLGAQAAAIARQSVPAPTLSRAPLGASGDNHPIGAAADAILEEYRVAPDSLKTDVRKGCLLYFFAALALVAAVVAILYYTLSAHS